jgi:tight adherence protein C
LLLLAFTLLCGAAVFALRTLSPGALDRRASLRRVQSYVAEELPAADGGPEREFGRHTDTLARVASRLDPRATVDRVGSRLVSAGMARTISPAGFLAAKVVLAAVGVVAGAAVGIAAGLPGRAVLLAVAAGVAGFFALDGLVVVRIHRRQEQMRVQLPDALDVLAVSVEAGLGFDASMAKLREHMVGPLVEEFSLAQAEIRVGETRHNALRKMADRTSLPEVGAFVTSIIQADQLGSPLGKILRIQAGESRARRQIAAEERAMKAPVKMLFPTGILIFPAMFIVILGPAVMKISQTF